MRPSIYLSFYGFFWLTLMVTLDRALLIALWTGYILLGQVSQWSRPKQIQRRSLPGE